MNTLSPKALTVAIVLWYCHSGPTGSEDAISLLTWTNYKKQNKTKKTKKPPPFVKQQHELEQAWCWGEDDWPGKREGLGSTLSGSKNFMPTLRIGFPGCSGPGSPLCRGRLLGLVSQWDPIGSLSPPTTAAGLLTSGHSFPRALFSPREPQVLFTREFTDGAAARRTDVLSPWSALI